MPVVTTVAKTASLPLDIRAIGTVEPLQSVAVRAQVSGVLQKVEFEEGQEVSAGQLLFRIDPRPFQIALKQALAALERDKVQAANAERDAQRYQGLAQKSYATQEQYESLRTAARAFQSVLAADEAAVEQARLNLAYCTIRASISGRTGNLMVKAGNLIRANDTLPLVVINQLDPILVRFSVPGIEFPAVQLYSAKRKLAVMVRPESQTESLTGYLSFIDNTVDTATGTILLKARFDNPQRNLWPGSYAEVTLRLDTETDLLVVPSPAIQAGQQGSYVFVVGDDLIVSLRAVTPGRSADGLTVIRDGIRQGEQVVVDGQLRLVNGTLVEVKASPGSTR